jgi:methylated-DNA-[protein]-cysteine S-methyltransferase
MDTSLKSGISIDAVHVTVFDTPIGVCGIAWINDAIVRVQLPEHSPQATMKKLLSYFRGASVLDTDAHGVAAKAIKAIQLDLKGTPQNLAKIPIDISSCPKFHQKVYEALRMVPRSKVVSYAELAYAAGSPLAFRAVGGAMARNPLALIIPCHRVLNSGGKLGGFSAYGGDKTKRRLLDLETQKKEAQKKETQKIECRA